MTHSFHCCAFKFPSRHDPKRHAERLKEIEKWQQQCNKKKNENDNQSDKSKLLQQQQSMRQQPSVVKSQEDKDDNKPSMAFSTHPWLIRKRTDNGGDNSNGFSGMGFGELFSGSTNDNDITWEDTTQQIYAYGQTTTSAPTLVNKDDKLNLPPNANGILYR